MAHDLKAANHMISQRPQPVPGYMPEFHLLLLWLVSFLAFVIWLRKEMDFVDSLVFSGVYILCLPIISPKTTPRFLACLGGVICGLIAGLQLIDLCFDIVILQDRSFSDGVDTISSRRVAFMYYHTVINASHVNAALLGIIVISFLGSFVGLGRCDPKTRATWIAMGSLMAVGTGGYLVSVVTRYVGIRSSKTYDPLLFEGWGYVLIARIVLYASITLSLPFLFSLQRGDAVANCNSAFHDKTK